MAMGIGKYNSISINSIIAGKDIPWVKDEPGNNIWRDWNAENRDLYILDKEARFRFRMNLTSGFDENEIQSKINQLLNE